MCVYVCMCLGVQAYSVAILVQIQEEAHIHHKQLLTVGPLLKFGQRACPNNGKLHYVPQELGDGRGVVAPVRVGCLPRFGDPAALVLHFAATISLLIGASLGIHHCADGGA